MFAYLFFIMYIEFHFVRMQTKFCRSCPHHTLRNMQQSNYIHCPVQCIAYLTSALFWGITWRRIIVLYRRFGTLYRPHLQKLSNP